MQEPVERAGSQQRYALGKIAGNKAQAFRNALETVFDGVFVQKHHLRRLRHMHPRVQKVVFQRFQETIVAVMKSGNTAQRFLRRAFAAADQLLTFPREIDLLQRIRPLSGKIRFAADSAT